MRHGKDETHASSSVHGSGVRNVFLIGFMGAGKTSVGRLLGQRLGWEFVDLDERIQAREGRSIEQIFAQSGEHVFRRLEHSSLRDLIAEQNSPPRIVALGGGAYVQAKNATLLAKAGTTVVFLDAPVEELFRRCQKERVIRPLQRDIEQFRVLYQGRRPAYAKADLVIDTNGKQVETVAAEIVQKLGLR